MAKHLNTLVTTATLYLKGGVKMELIPTAKRSNKATNTIRINRHRIVLFEAFEDFFNKDVIVDLTEDFLTIRLASSTSLHVFKVIQHPSLKRGYIKIQIPDARFLCKRYRCQIDTDKIVINVNDGVDYRAYLRTDT